MAASDSNAVGTKLVSTKPGRVVRLVNVSVCVDWWRLWSWSAVAEQQLTLVLVVSSSQAHLPAPARLVTLAPGCLYTGI